MEGSLRRAEVGRKEQIVGIEDSNNGHTTKVEALGYHLCADQDIGLATLKFTDYTVVGALRSRCITVQTCHAGIGEEFGYGLLDFLGTEAHRLQFCRFAMGTIVSNGGCMTAIMALHTLRCTVPGQRDVTIGTTHRPATLLTRNEGRESSPVLEQHHLLTSRQGIAYGIYECKVEMALAFTSLYRTHRVRQNYARLACSTITLQQS